MVTIYTKWPNENVMVGLYFPEYVDGITGVGGWGIFC